MYYATVGALINDALRYYDDIDDTLITDLTVSQNRMLHYYDRAVEEICRSRPWWPFMYANTTVALSGGIGTLPVDFSGIGPEGYVISEVGGLPWSEVNYQEILSIRNNSSNAAANDRLFAIGPPDQTLQTPTQRLRIFVSRIGDARTLTITYEKTLAAGSLSTPLFLPYYLHHAALAGTVFYAAKSKNDGRADMFRAEFNKALSDGIKVGRPKRHRVNQLPMTVGNMW